MSRPTSWIAIALALSPLAAWAQSCEMLSLNVDEARTALQRAARASDLDEGRDSARRAKSALEDASMSAMDCKCDMTYMEFDDAATRARRARDASDGREFVENLNRAIRSYNSALDAVRVCASDRRR
jgi:hypothetical protein